VAWSSRDVRIAYLNERKQEELTRIIKRHRSEQQQVLRARIVLLAAEGH